MSMNESLPTRAAIGRSIAESLITWKGGQIGGLRELNVKVDDDGDIELTVTIEVGKPYGKRRRFIEDLEAWGARVITVPSSKE